MSKKWGVLALEECFVYFLVCNKEVHCSLAIPFEWHWFSQLQKGERKGPSGRPHRGIMDSVKDSSPNIIVKEVHYGTGTMRKDLPGGRAQALQPQFKIMKINYPTLNYLYQHSVADVNVQKVFFSLLYFIFIYNLCIAVLAVVKGA